MKVLELDASRSAQDGVQFYLNGATQIPVVGGSRKGQPTYRLFVNAWRRIPLPMTEVLGPWLRRQMPFG